ARFYERSPHETHYRSDPADLSDDSLGQSFARSDLARRHGSGASVVLGFLATPGRHHRVIRFFANSFRAGVVGDLSTPSSAHAIVGSAAAYVRSLYSSASRGPFCRHAPDLRMVRSRGFLRENRFDAVEIEPHSRHQAGASHRDRVDPRLYRISLLATTPAAVSALCRAVFHGCSTIAGLGVAGFRPGRARDRFFDRPRPRLGRADEANG